MILRMINFVLVFQNAFKSMVEDFNILFLR